MEELSQLACRVANRVALSMAYGETTGARVPARQMVSEAFDATCDLLDRINPVELRDWFAHFHGVYLTAQSDLIDDPVIWSKFLGTQCDLLHQVGWHQKTIARVGDELAIWERRPISFDEFGDALDGLAGLVSDHAGALSGVIERDAGPGFAPHRRAELFSNSVCGLTIVLITINQAMLLGDPRDKNCAAFATFGASLTNASVKPLFQACNLT